MKIEFFIENDGSYGAKIMIEKETIFAHGKTLNKLEQNMHDGLKLAVVKDSKKAKLYKPFLRHFITNRTNHASHA